MLAHEVLSRNMHDRQAIARYAGLIGSPDESGPMLKLIEGFDKA
jgi:transposase